MVEYENHLLYAVVGKDTIDRIIFLTITMLIVYASTCIDLIVQLVLVA